MTTSGLTNAGFIAPTTDELTSAISSDMQAGISATLNTSPNTPIGQINAVFSARLALVWEALATIWGAIDPDLAEGVLLANDAALTGTRPQVATFGTVVLSMSLNATSTVNPGAIAAVAGQPTNQWVLVGALGLPAGSAVVSTTAGTYSGLFRASTSGPVNANASTITSIVTPVTGWTAVTNPSAATPGVAADTDATLRVKQQAELAGEGSGNLDALKAAVLKVPGVLAVFAAENTALTPDVNGVPGKAFHVFVWDGLVPAASNTAIAQAIWNNKPSGIQPFGATSAFATDSGGNNQLVSFDRATQVPIFLTLTTTPDTLPTVGGVQFNAIKANLAAYAAANWQVGGTVFALPLRNAALLPGVVFDIPTFFLGTSASPSGTANIAIGAQQIATLSVANISVS